MTKRRLLPYILTIAAFDLIYLLTMVIYRTDPMSYESPWLQPLGYGPMHLQMEIFQFLLPLVILGINLLEIVTTKDDNFILRVAKSLLTIILAYVTAYFVFLLIDMRIWNLFYHYRGAPAKFSSLISIFLTVFGLGVLEGVKRIYLLRFKKSLINKFVPAWLQLEKC